MNNIEIEVQIAVKALNQKLLSDTETQFIKKISAYPKKELNRLTDKQRKYLKDIYNKYSKLL